MNAQIYTCGLERVLVVVDGLKVFRCVLPTPVPEEDVLDFHRQTRKLRNSPRRLSAYIGDWMRRDELGRHIE